MSLVSLQITQLNDLAATIWILLVSALLILISCFSSTVASSFGILGLCLLISGDLTRDGPASYIYLLG